MAKKPLKKKHLKIVIRHQEENNLDVESYASLWGSKDAWMNIGLLVGKYIPAFAISTALKKPLLSPILSGPPLGLAALRVFPTESSKKKSKQNRPKEDHPKEKYFTAYSGKNMLGALKYLRWVDVKGRLNFLLHTIVVHKDFRNKGIAKKMMKKFISHIETEAKQPTIFRISMPVHLATLKLATKARMMFRPTIKVGSKRWEHIKKLAGKV